MPYDAQRTFRASTRDLLWLPLGAIFAIACGELAGYVISTRPSSSLNCSACLTMVILFGFFFVSVRRTHVLPVGIRNGSGHTIPWAKISNTSFHPVPFGSTRVQAGTWDAIVIAPSIIRDPEFEKAVREVAPSGNPLLGAFRKRDQP
jgi:hypothetical protein